jgi:undecaprenyl-diphosphatase
MTPLNQHLFLLLNAPAGASPIAVGFATVLANDLVYFVPFLLLGLWVWSTSSARAGLLTTSVMAALALFANQVVGQFWYEPRPFMIGLGRTLLHHAPENSFPSDHTTLIVSVGIGLFVTGAAKRWGAVVTVAGAVVGWARIYLGLHFPVDVLVSFLIGGLFGTTAGPITPTFGIWIVPRLENIYCRVLGAIHLSANRFPRGQGRD